MTRKVCSLLRIGMMALTLFSGACAASRFEGDAGTPATVAGDAANERALMTYSAAVQKAIQRNWKRPAVDSASAPTKVTIFVRIDADGRAYDTRIDKSSGDARVDEAALEALNRSAPFPPPPPELAAEFARKGIALIFDPSRR